MGGVGECKVVPISFASFLMLSLVFRLFSFVYVLYLSRRVVLALSCPSRALVSVVVLAAMAWFSLSA